jgi:hypothetical protein
LVHAPIDNWIFPARQPKYLGNFLLAKPMLARLKSIIMNKAKRDQQRARLRAFMKQIGTNAKAMSLKAELGATFVSEFLNGKSEAKDQNLEALCKANGIRWEWFRDGTGPQLASEPIPVPLDREAVLLGLEGVVAYFRPDARVSRLRVVAEALLESVEALRGDMSESDRRRSIHSEIRGALGIFFRQLNQQDTE